MRLSCQSCGRVIRKVPASALGKSIRCVCGGTFDTCDRRTANYATKLSYGTGSDLKALFAEESITETVGCNCTAVAAAMDLAGVAGCRERRDYFLAKLKENASKYTWWETIKAGNKLRRHAWFHLTDPLGSCFDEAIRRAEAKDAWQPVRHCLYHVAPLLSNDLWKTNVRQLIRRAAVFTGRRIAAIATGPECHPPAIVREAFDGSGFEFLEVPNDKQLREVASFVPLLRQVEHEPGVTFYAHTKGNSTALNVTGAMRWRNAMYHYLLDDFEPVRRALTAHAFCGTHKMKWHGPPPYPTGLQAGNWMLAGTFYWLRHDRIFSVPNWWDLPADRYAAEAWPSMIGSEADAWSLYQPWPKNEKHPNPYDPKLYPAEFDDE